MLIAFAAMLYASLSEVLVLEFPKFYIELHPSADRVVQMQFRVEDNTLVNLSAPAPGPADGIASVFHALATFFIPFIQLR